MEKKLKTIRLLIIFILFIIIFTTIIVITLYKKNTKGTSEENSVTEFEKRDTYQPNDKIEKVKNKNKYYTTIMLVQRYFTYAKDLNSNNIEKDIKELTQTAFMDILDNKYKNEFDINKELEKDVYKNISSMDEIEIDDMYLIDQSGADNIFLVYGKIYSAKENFQLMVRTDSRNSIFSIFPEEYVKKYNYSFNSDKSDFENIFSEPLEKKEYNTYKYTTVSDERMSVVYFNQIKNKLLGSTDTVYNMLDDEYYQKRFGSKEKLEAFLKSNQKELAKIEIKSYLVNYHTDYNEYVCKDQNDKVYVIEEYAVNDYKVQLDDYTIPDEELNKKYMSLTTQEKVVNNVNKWIKMLNYRDYESAFNVLDETFRKENFGNDVSKFEQYMRQKFPDHYKFDQVKYMQEAGISEQQITMSPISGGLESQIQETIYMQLKEDTNFVMSFNII